ncbi:pinin [Drosophila navojoa]|uniref:pinin n=1 Tax=Drosophila navojoa TaxID=7232 RepID=UPI000846C193|nr:pinin [Drosophila navojoa]
MEDNIASSSVGDLEKKLHSARQSLISLNDNIRRLVGRGLKEPRVEKYNPDILSKKNEQNEDKTSQRHDPLKQKRRTHDGKLVFNRVSDKDEMWLPTPRLNSRVIRELPSREEIVEAQGIDSESRARNRRMFGSLLGTLQKFCQEESRLKKTEEKKALIEKKLENQEQQERALLQKERDLLFLDRKRKQLEIRCLEKKMARLRDFKAWESSMIYQQNQIRTKSKPHIYFQPRIHTVQTEKLLAKSKCELENLLERRREDLQIELRRIESSSNIDDDSALDDNSIYENKSNKEPMESNIPDPRDNNSKEEFRNVPNEDNPLTSSSFVIQEA